MIGGGGRVLSALGRFNQWGEGGREGGGAVRVRPILSPTLPGSAAAESNTSN